MLQRMPAAEMFMHFMDLHQAEGEEDLSRPVGQEMSPTELAELTMSQVVRKLIALAVEARRVPAPQKWIGSSVALGFDDQSFPSRSEPEEQVRRRVRVHIFDWGRSELNTLAHHAKLSEKEQDDRFNFWSYYVGGIDRLSWEASRAYFHRYGNVRSWSDVTIRVFDFDSLFWNEHLGKARIELREVKEATQSLMNEKDQPVYGKTGLSSITYGITWRAYPKGSRLRGAWRIHVVKASNLPPSDILRFQSSSDPFATICATGSGGALALKWKLCCRMDSCLVPNSLEPVWKETFELPIAASADNFSYDICGNPGNSLAFAEMFPMPVPQGAEEGPVAEALKQWKALLDNHAFCDRRRAVTEQCSDKTQALDGRMHHSTWN